MKQQTLECGVSAINAMMNQGWVIVPRTLKVKRDKQTNRLVVFGLLEKDEPEEVEAA